MLLDHSETTKQSAYYRLHMCADSMRVGTLRLKISNFMIIIRFWLAKNAIFELSRTKRALVRLSMVFTTCSGHTRGSYTDREQRPVAAGPSALTNTENGGGDSVCTLGDRWTRTAILINLSSRYLEVNSR